MGDILYNIPVNTKCFIVVNIVKYLENSNICTFYVSFGHGVILSMPVSPSIDQVVSTITGTSQGPPV